MYILALETTGKFGSASIIDAEGRCVAAHSEDSMNHLKDITLLSRDCCSQMGITPSELTHVAASVGPGSFTGIRIGVTTARTLGQMLDIPCIAVSSLESMAEQCFCHFAEGRQLSSSPSVEMVRWVCPIINARRHQTYAGLWQVKENNMEPVLPEKQYMIEDLLSELQERDGITAFVGDGIDAYESIIRETMPAEKFLLAEENARYQNALFVAKIAVRKALSGDVCAYEELLPNYMRKSEAEIRLEEGTLSKRIHG